MSSYRANANAVGLASNTRVADIDIVIACGEINAGLKTHGDVSVTGGVAIECKSTVGRVVVSGVVKERLPTGSGVLGAGCAESQGCAAVSGVAGAVRVAKERGTTGGRVVVSGYMAKQRITTNGGVGEPGRAAIERIKTEGSVVAGCVVKKR